jgi:hypothetical protein
LNVVLAVQPTTNMLSQLYGKFETELSTKQSSEFKLLLDKAVRQISLDVRAQALDYSDMPDELKDSVRTYLKGKLVEDEKKKGKGRTSISSVAAHETGTSTGTCTTPPGKRKFNLKKPPGTSTSTTATAPYATATTVATSGTCTGDEMDFDDDVAIGNLKLPALQYCTQTTVPRGANKTDTLEEYRSRYKKTKNSNERINVCVDIDKYLVTTYLHNGYDSKTANLTENTRVWYQKNIKKVNECIERCHNSSTTEFQRKIGEVLGRTLFQGILYNCPECGGSSTKKNTK